MKLSVWKKSKSVTNLVRSTQLEIPDREKRGIERKCNFMIDLRCYKLFHWTVGPMDVCNGIPALSQPKIIFGWYYIFGCDTAHIRLQYFRFCTVFKKPVDCLSSKYDKVNTNQLNRFDTFTGSIWLQHFCSRWILTKYTVKGSRQSLLSMEAANHKSSRMILPSTRL